MAHKKKDKSKPPDVSTESIIIKLMQPSNALISIILGGTDAMRAAGEVYLPQYEGESQGNWNRRRDRAVLTNFLRRTLSGLSGKPFSKEVELSDDMPKPLIELVDNIDQRGNNLHVFARRFFESGLAFGLVHLIVDFPIMDDEAVKTLADEKNVRARPYFVQVDHNNIIAAYSEVINGVETLTHVRIRENAIVRDGEFGEKEVQRIREMEPGRFRLWQLSEDTDDWEIFRDWTIVSLDFIPLITFYANRKGFMLSEPPLLDLAHLNVAHWQSASDQRTILTVARFPILAATGITEEEGDKKIGPTEYLTASSETAKWYYVEHEGKAIGAGRQDLIDLGHDMALMGLELLNRPGNITATGKALDTAENNSALQQMVLRLVDVMQTAFGFAATWLNIEEPVGSVGIHVDFGLKVNEAADLQTLLDSREKRDLSQRAFLDELQRRGILLESFDLEKNNKELEQERLDMVAGQAFVNQLQNDGTLPQPKLLNSPAAEQV